MIHNSISANLKIILIMITAAFILLTSLNVLGDETDQRWVPTEKTQPAGETNERWEKVENKSPEAKFEDQNGEKGGYSMAAAVTLTILPGFGAGHFYIGDKHGGVTFLVMDIAIDGLGLSTFIMFMLTTAPAFTKIAMFIVPLTWGVLKAVEIADIVKKVQVANNPAPSFTMIPNESVSTPYMATVLRF